MYSEKPKLPEEVPNQQDKQNVSVRNWYSSSNKKVTVMQTYILYGNKRQHLTFITEVMYSAMLIAVNLQLITLTFFAQK